MNPNKQQLAIVIPAYKETYLRKALQSLAQQTCKDFIVYIGDDASPHPIAPIVDDFKDKMSIVYHRFSENRGGRDLVAQWTRCIDLTNGEPWLWLFSDDDMLSPDCVKAFYEEINSGKPVHDIYKFNVQVIDNDDRELWTVTYHEQFSSYELYRDKNLGRRHCFVVEFIFSRAIYESAGGFESFDLAWGSDVATWVKFGLKSGIKTLPHGTVLWRSSGENISTKVSMEIEIRKIEALLLFFKWGVAHRSQLGHDVQWINDVAFFKWMVVKSKILPYDVIMKYIHKYTSNSLKAFILKCLFPLGKLMYKR